jgi:NADH-ubiquinone oxidoreductase chain 2
MLALSFAITLFSLAGVPPLLGFYGKMQVLLSAISVKFIFVSLIAINMSVVSAYYYLKLIQVSNFINTNNLNPTISYLEKSLLNIKNPGVVNISNSLNYIGVSPKLGDLNKEKYSIYLLNNIHSYLISLITLIILLFTFKSDLLFNITSIISSYYYYV